MLSFVLLVLGCGGPAMHEYRSEAYGFLTDMPGQPKDVLPCPVWSTDGEFFYLLTNNAGVLRRIAVAGVTRVVFVSELDPGVRDPAAGARHGLRVARNPRPREGTLARRLRRDTIRSRGRLRVCERQPRWHTAVRGRL